MLDTPELMISRRPGPGSRPRHPSGWYGLSLGISSYESRSSTMPAGLCEGRTGGRGTEQPMSTVVRLNNRRLSGTHFSGVAARRARRLRGGGAPPFPAASAVADKRPRVGTLSRATVVGESALAAGEAVDAGDDSAAVAVLSLSSAGLLVSGEHLRRWRFKLDKTPKRRPHLSQAKASGPSAHGYSRKQGAALPFSPV